VFIDSSYFTGCFFAANSTSKAAGNFANILAHFSFITYSAVNPPPATVLGYKLNAVPNNVFVSKIALDVSALS